MKLKPLLPTGTFISTMHFHGIITSWDGDTILFYQDAWGNNDSGIIKIPLEDMKDSIESSEYVEINKRGVRY